MYLNRIVVPVGYRENGVGTSMMELLVQKLGERGLHCTVHPTGNYNSDVERLTRFFMRFGFEPLHGEAYTLVREHRARTR
jgi:predicted GNAT family N-acyltransferase